MWRGLKAWREARDELAALIPESTPELLFTVVSDLILIRASDAAVETERRIGGVLERADGAGADVISEPAQAWLLRKRHGGLVRVARAQGALEVADLGGEQWRGRVVLAVPSADLSDQGRLALLGPEADRGLIRLVALAPSSVTERWARNLFPGSRGLRDVYLIPPRTLLIEDLEERAVLAGAVDGAPHHKGFLAAPNLLARSAGQVWFSHAQRRGITLWRADREAAVRFFLVDTLGASHVVFDRSGRADWTLALIQSDAVLASEGVLNGFDMSERPSELDRLLREFARTENSRP
jgi:hypothetical protein